MVALGTRFLSLLTVVMLTLGTYGCQNESAQPSATQKTLDDLQTKYDVLLKDKVGVPVEWAAQDLENIGDWEYRVISLAYTTPEDLESQLNEFGNDRWDVIWLEKTPGGFLAILKKPSISYLSKIPLSQIGRMAIGGSDGQE